MSEHQEPETPPPAGLALRLTLYLVPGGAAAAVLWHEVVNPLLAGRPARTSTWTAAAMVLLLAATMALLARDLRRLSSEDRR